MARKIKIATLSDIPLNTNKAFKVEGRSVLLCRTPDGVFALENRCSHQLATLEGGRMRGPHLFCPKHFARFDLRTGETNGTLAKEPIQAFVVTVDADENIEIDWPK